MALYKLRRNLVASYPILASWSSLEISKERTQSGRKIQRYSKLFPELKAEIVRWAAKHGCWAMGVVSLRLEVGRASTPW